MKCIYCQRRAVVSHSSGSRHPSINILSSLHKTYSSLPTRRTRSWYSSRTVARAVKSRSAANMHVELLQSFLTPRGNGWLWRKWSSFMRLLASTCFPSRRRFAANPGDLPIFLARIKKNFDQRRRDMSLGLVLLRSGGLVLVGFSSTAAAGHSMHRSSTGDSMLESGAQVASVWLASRVGLGKQEGKGWKLPSICNLL